MKQVKVYVDTANFKGVNIETLNVDSNDLIHNFVYPMITLKDLLAGKVTAINATYHLNEDKAVIAQLQRKLNAIQQIIGDLNV